MRSRPRPYFSINHFSEDFVICAGSVLFRAAPGKREWQICILHSPMEGVWVLPKGRKDRGESVENAALRETYEETGYRCEFLPCRMATRAPLPHINMVDEPRIVEGVVEPFAMTVRSLGEARGTKIIWWYLTRAIDETQFKGTQTETEDFQSEFITAEKAVEQLTFQDDREVASKALELVLATKCQYST
ncbi:NUDIX hydrolase domain-like protein [Lanmaoa asiatica]|nr:NUDIX hydrolase domain-like protein [Lanmaoa asiatica]